MGVLTITLLALTVMTFIYFFYLSIRLHREKPAGLAWRGIIKLVALQGVPAPISQIYPRWFQAFWAFFILISLLVASAVWDSDHSFLVFIFPLLFYYFFARYFLWEKHDLND
jgi:hypothetical protein